MMTDDELDLLASSYLDGEATSDEVALVEADPDLRARVEQLRLARVTSVAAPPGLAQAQIARAMAGFVPGVGGDRAAGGAAAGAERAAETETDAEAVIDLSERRRQREGRLRWLTSAAAVLVVGIGTVAVINQMGDSDDDEMATADVATDATAAAEVAPAADADTAGGDGTDTAGGDEAATMAQSEMVQSEMVEDAGDGGALAPADEVAEEEDVAEEETAEAADAEEELARDESEADADEAPSAERLLRDLPELGFFPDEPVAEYTRLPSGDEMVGDLELPWRDETTASCLDAFPSDGSPYAFDEVEVLAHLPFEVTGGDDVGLYEALYVIVDEAEELVVVLGPGDCMPVAG